MTKETGGPAFPTGTAYQGMALRDYFASKALQPLMAISGGYWSTDNLKTYARISYQVADAMLKAREQ